MTESSEQASLAAMTAEIVSAYVSHNQIATAELAGLNSAVAGPLGTIGTEPGQPAEKNRNRPCRSGAPFALITWSA